MPIEIRQAKDAGNTHYVTGPQWVNNPDDPLFFIINRGTNSELVINLYKLLDWNAVLVEHDALEGPFGSALPVGPKYTITNAAEERSLDGLQTTVDSLVATLQTLITDLTDMGLLET
jgi:hypothetical protein